MIFYLSVGTPVLPIKYSGLRDNIRKTVAVFVVVFIVDCCGSPNVPTNISSSARKERQFSVCSSVISTNCSCNLSI